MTLHGLRPEFQPENINAKARQAHVANAQVDRPIRGHNNVVPQSKEVTNNSQLLDVRG